MSALTTRLSKILGTKVHTASELALVGYQACPTGVHHLDKVLGGGILKGKVTQIWGTEQAGKSTLAARFVAECQANDPEHVCVWFDTEFRFNPVRVAAQGVDMERLLVIPGNYAEETLQNIVRAVLEEETGSVVVDSLGNLLPSKYKDYTQNSAKTSKERARPTKTPGEFAQIVSGWCGEITAALNAHPIPFVVLNHVRKQIGVLYGSPDIYPGGERYNHIITTSIKVNKGRDVIINDVRVGISSSYSVHKTDFDTFKSDEKTRLVLWFSEEARERGEVDAVVEEALDLGILVQKQSRYTSSVEEIGISAHGRAKLLELLNTDHDLLSRLNNEIDTRRANGTVSKSSTEESDSTELAD